MIWLESGVSVGFECALQIVALPMAGIRRSGKKMSDGHDSCCREGFCVVNSPDAAKGRGGLADRSVGVRNEAVCMSIRTNKKQHFDTNEGPATVCHVPCKQEGTVASKNIDTHTYTLT